MGGLSELELKVYQYINGKPKGSEGSSIAKNCEIPVENVAKIINSLSRKGLIEMRSDKDGKLTYNAVTASDRKKINDLDEDDRLVYNTIKAAGNEGIWTRNLKTKTNLHQTVITRSLKNLESKQLIKAIKSVKAPTRKIYMLYELTPSAEVSGGPWFTDQELDTDFVETLTKAIHKFIYSRSFPRKDAYTVFPASRGGFVSAVQIHRFIEESKLTTVDLSLDHINSLLDLLIFDGKIERRISDSGATAMELNDVDDDEPEIVYKAVKDRRGGGNPWTDTPCGKCPVFNDCTDDGLITPRKCIYYRKWLLDF